jgi:hypothetical protein
MLVSYFLDINVKIATKLITISGKNERMSENNDDMLVKDSRGVMLKDSPTEAFKNTYKNTLTIPTEKSLTFLKFRDVSFKKGLRKFQKGQGLFSVYSLL